MKKITMITIFNILLVMSCYANAGLQINDITVRYAMTSGDMIDNYSGACYRTKSYQVKFRTSLDNILIENGDVKFSITAIDLNETSLSLSQLQNIDGVEATVSSKKITIPIRRKGLAMANFALTSSCSEESKNHLLVVKATMGNLSSDVVITNLPDLRI